MLIIVVPFPDRNSSGSHNFLDQFWKFVSSDQPQGPEESLPGSTGCDWCHLHLAIATALPVKTELLIAKTPVLLVLATLVTSVADPAVEVTSAPKQQLSCTETAVDLKLEIME